MDCVETLEWMEAGELGAVAEADAALVEARRHFADCPECQQAWPARQAWAQTLSVAMSQVEIPAGLRSRLQDSLPLLAPAAAKESLTTPPRRRVSRWVGGGLAAISIAALVMVNSFWQSPPPPVLLSQLIGGASVEYAVLPGFRGSFTPRLPSEWSSVFTLDPVLVRGFPPDGPAASQVAFVPFQFAIRSGQEPLRGRLLMVPQSQLVLSVDGPSRLTLVPQFASAQVRYLTDGRGAFVVWAEDDLVFVCLMPSGPADLERFQRALSGSRSLT